MDFLVERNWTGRPGFATEDFLSEITAEGKKDRRMLELEGLITKAYYHPDGTRLHLEKLLKDGGITGRTKNVQEVERKIGEIFNFKEVEVVTNLTAPDVNAYTEPNIFSSHSPFPPKVEKDNGVYRYKTKSESLSITILPGILGHLTPGELTAVIMHEIGHNFFRYGLMSTVASFVKAIGLWIGFVLGLVIGGIGSLVDMYDKFRYRNSAKFRKYYQSLVKHADKRINAEKNYGAARKKAVALQSVMLDWMVTLSLAPLIVKYAAMIGVYLSFVTAAVIIKDYPNEEFADNFAVRMGYGGELASALRKLEKTFDRKTYMMGPMTFMFGIVKDTHPQSSTRMVNMIKLLRKMKGEAVTPMARENIQSQIDMVEDTLNTLRKDKNYGEVPLLDKFKQALTGVTNWRDKDVGDLAPLEKG